MFIVLLILLFLYPSHGATLPSFFSNKMILQRNEPIVVWGQTSCTSGSINIELREGGTLVTSASIFASSVWTAYLSQQPHSILSHTLTVVDCEGTTTINNIVIGDIIMCSGQSNMVKSVSQMVSSSELSQTKTDAIAYPYTRFWDTSDTGETGTPQFNLNSQNSYNWIIAADDTSVFNTQKTPGATCYYTMFYLTKYWKDIEGIDMPIGAFNLGRSGSGVAQWFPSTAYSTDDPSCGGISAVASNDIGTSANSNYFNRYLAPVLKMPFIAFVWYQGEKENGQDVNAFDGYGCAQGNLLAALKQEFNRDFYFGVTGLSSTGNDAFPYVFRTFQQQTILQLPNVAYVTASDLGQNGGTDPVHPKHKIELGRRHAVSILRQVNQWQIAKDGPIFESFTSVNYNNKEYLRIGFLAQTSHALEFLDTKGCSFCCGSTSGIKIQFQGGSLNEVPTARIILDVTALYIDLSSYGNSASNLDIVQLNYEPFAQCTIGNNFECTAGILPAREFYYDNLQGTISAGNILPGDVEYGNPETCPQVVLTSFPTKSPTTSAPTQSPIPATPRPTLTPGTIEYIELTQSGIQTPENSVSITCTETQTGAVETNEHVTTDPVGGLYYYYELDNDGSYNYVTTANAVPNQYDNSLWNTGTGGTQDIDSVATASASECEDDCNLVNACIGFSWRSDSGICKLYLQCRSKSTPSAAAVDTVQLRQNFAGGFYADDVYAGTTCESSNKVGQLSQSTPVSIDDCFTHCQPLFATHFVYNQDMQCECFKECSTQDDDKAVTYVLNVADIETEAPTSNPTPAPTPPTPKPTESPTKKPTKSPTQSPTPRPTKSPTKQPTDAPTQSPTPKPTNKPTESPTQKPTQSPTGRPSKSPTKQPTNKPTTAAPTTPIPSRNPTKKPTLNPTNSPTFRPTNRPSKAPTPSAPTVFTNPPAVLPYLSNQIKQPLATSTRNLLIVLGTIFGSIFVIIMVVITKPKSKYIQLNALN